MSQLLDQQQTFAYNQALFVAWCYGNGYKLTYGEAFRPLEMAQLDASRGIGISKTLHGQRLAVDWNLFVLVNGVWTFVTDVASYAPLGAHWKSLHPLNRWGGDFKAADGSPKPDADHFSMEYGGIK